MNMKKFLLNVISPILIYGGLLVLSIVVSRLFLVGYGSEVNGLLSSVNQIFAYIALLEAGIGTATISALYGPLSQKNTGDVNAVLSASRRYYRKSAFWYFICVFVASIVWPLVLDTEIPFITIWALIFFQGVSGVLTYCYTSTINNYLVASGRNYINNYVHIVVTVLTYIIRIVICYAHLDIVTLSFGYLAVNLLKLVFYSLYMKKVCPDFGKQKNGDTSLLKQRNSFLVHEISGVIFSGTDTIIISIFCGLAEASIYAVYSMVLTSVNTIIGQALNGTYYILGNSYSKDKDGYANTHDTFNSIYISAVFIVFTVTFLLLLPFVSLYTSGVTDANYLDGNLPLLFVLIQLLSVCRMVDNYLIKISLHAKQTISRTITESVINLTASLILVQFMGIYGVLCGTILALLYRVNDMIIYSNKRILKRSPLKEYKLYLANFAVFGIFAFVSRQITIVADSYFHLILIAVAVTTVVAIAYLLVNSIVNYKELKGLLNMLKARKCNNE